MMSRTLLKRPQNELRVIICREALFEGKFATMARSYHVGAVAFYESKRDFNVG